MRAPMSASASSHVAREKPRSPRRRTQRVGQAAERVQRAFRAQRGGVVEPRAGRARPACSAGAGSAAPGTGARRRSSSRAGRSCRARSRRKHRRAARAARSRGAAGCPRARAASRGSAWAFGCRARTERARRCGVVRARRTWPRKRARRTIAQPPGKIVDTAKCDSYRCFRRIREEFMTVAAESLIPEIETREKRESYEQLVQRLSVQSVRKHYGAYEDIDWDAPEMQIDRHDPRFELPDEDTLGHTEWYKAQPQHVRAELGLSRFRRGDEDGRGVRERAQARPARVRVQPAEPLDRVSLRLPRGDRGGAALADVPGVHQPLGRGSERPAVGQGDRHAPGRAHGPRVPGAVLLLRARR